MQPEPEALVQRAQPRPLSIAVEPHVSPVQQSGSLDGPLQQRCRNSLSDVRAPHGKPMHERGIVRVEVGPEQPILELEAHRADKMAIDFSDDEKTCFHLGPDAMIFKPPSTHIVVPSSC